MIYRGQERGMGHGLVQGRALRDGIGPHISAFYGPNQDETTVPGPQTLKGLTVTTRMVENYLLVFLERAAT